jgi:hypothetical protein
MICAEVRLTSLAAILVLVVAQQKYKVVRAKHGYTKASEGELSMQKGDEIRVTEEDDTGWWKGILRGEEGWFPFNYVEEVK